MTICVFGDSIAWGASDFEKGGWVERLKMHYLRERDLDLYNLGISGDNSADVLERFEREASIREPDLVIFAVGVNDSQYILKKERPRTRLARFERNLTALVKSADKLTNGKAMLVGLTLVDEDKTTPIPWSRDKFYDNESVRTYNAVIQKVARKLKVPFIPVHDVLDAGDLEDGLHPNSEGHRKLFEHIKGELEKVNFLHP